TTPTTPTTPTGPSGTRPQPPALSSAFPADGFTTNALAMDASGTATPDAAVTATAAPGGGTGIRSAAAAAATLGSTTAGADGSWGLGLDLAGLADGTWTLSFTQTTAAGTSDAVARSIVIDRTALPPTIATVDTGTGAIAGYAAPIVSGTAEPGASVEVSDGGTVLTTVTAAADGSWTTGELTHVGQEFAITARQTDVLGNVSAWSGPTTGSVLAPSITATVTQFDVAMTAYGRPETGLLLYVNGSPAGPTLRTAADGTAAQTYEWVGPPGTYRLGFGYDFGDRHGIVMDAPVTFPGLP
ncbi:Ig-like domain-containing protein, partial [Leifsonia sp. LS1]|uniref:Ig-like domain-containing protein n=1 Tax=Leifsonia sp. LS1 TaxID=2828483 RepID=UPI001CFE6CF5